MSKKKIEIDTEVNKRKWDNDYYNDEAVTVEKQSQRPFKGQPCFCGWFCHRIFHLWNRQNFHGR